MENINKSKYTKHKNNKETKKKVILIYPMISRKYTAIQRAKLRKFEKELYAGEKVIIE